MREWQNLDFLKNPSFEFGFLDNLPISGFRKCKIFNLGIKMSKTPKYGLWEMMGIFYLCFQEISLKHTLLGPIKHCACVYWMDLYFIMKENLKLYA